MVNYCKPPLKTKEYWFNYPHEIFEKKIKFCTIWLAILFSLGALPKSFILKGLVFYFIHFYCYHLG